MATRKAVTAVELPAPLVARATTAAKRRRRSVAAIIADALERYLEDLGPQSKPPTARPRGKNRKQTADLADLFATVRAAFRDVPASEWKKLPRDGSLDPDRYIYGRP